MGDNGPATSASVGAHSVAIGADGSVYIADLQGCVRQVTPDGIIHTFAGQCFNSGFSGDGGPATSAQLSLPEDLAIGPDGSLYIADTDNQRIRRVDPRGIITTVAGSGPTATGSFSGDGGPAVQATLQQPWVVDVAADGTIYIADLDNGRIRRVAPDGTIKTIAGDGSNDQFGNNVPAITASLNSPLKVRLARDGSFYIVELNGFVVRQVGTDGIIRAFAGGGSGPFGSGDGGPATTATLRNPRDAAVGPDGSVYILDDAPTVRRVTPDGIISTFAGVVDNYTFGGDLGPAAAATFGVSEGIRVAPDNSVYLADSADNRVRRVQATLTGFSSATNFSLPSGDGRQVYVFDASGRHLQTLDAFTKAILYQFAYDGGGRVATVTDVDGNVTQINHDTSGNLTSVIGPFGLQTTFTPDSHGYLASATDPASQQTQFTYDTNGLMLTKTNPRGGLSQYSYDSLGRLSEDQDPAGGSKTLTRADTETGFTVTKTTGLGRQSTYQTTSSSTGTFGRQNTLANGLQSSLQFTPDGTTTVTLPDGTTTTTTEQPDPRIGFGMLSPTLSVTTRTTSGLTSTRTTTRTVTLSGDIQTAFTEQTSVNGDVWTKAFDANALTWTTTSPAGRPSVTTIDVAGRPAQIAIPNVAPFTFAYDSHGRLTTTAQGSRTWTQAYDAQGYVAAVTDPLGHALSYTNDAVGRPTQTTLPDGRFLGTGYDADSNTSSMTLPSHGQHLFTYSPVEELASYTPPSVSSASPTTSYAYDLDRNLKTMTRPDGVALTYGYDSAGRLQTTTYPQGTLSVAYSSTSGQVSSRTAASGELLQYGYDGFLRNSVAWSGPVAGSLSLGFDNNFRMTSQTVNGTALAFGYDLDGLLTGAGALTLSLDLQNGRLTGTTLGSMTDTYTYDVNGLFASYTAKHSGTTLYSEAVLRDAVGRITQKTETVQGTTNVWGYTFDTAGRLTDVTEDGNFFSHYGYDADDNRTTYTNTSGTVNPTYDAQDRLTAYGGATYGYTANGELTSKTVGGQTTSYTYDALGNLLHVGPPTGSAIDYVIDGENRRVGKKLAGTLSQGFLYQDALNVVAQLDGSGNLVGRYVFGSKPNVADYFTTSAGMFRILSDHLGSPRLIVNASTGAVVEEIDYDEFGNITNDTSPGLTPFGFAGGLYDKDAGFVRFGARDYDASVGRWTSKDPIRFTGGLNLYGYLGNDPVNDVDSFGLMDGSEPPPAPSPPPVCAAPDPNCLNKCAAAYGDAIGRCYQEYGANSLPQAQCLHRADKALDRCNFICQPISAHP